MHSTVAAAFLLAARAIAQTTEPSPTGAYVCGATLSASPTERTSSIITCPSTVPSPSSNARLRIEGPDSQGTIFEDCIEAGPRNITISDGNTYKCDGTTTVFNTSQQQSLTPTQQLDAASKLKGFSYVANWDSAYEDIIVDSIAGGPANDLNTPALWGAAGADFSGTVYLCMTQSTPQSDTVYAWDLFHNGQLRVDPDYIVAKVGDESVSVNITERIHKVPIEGASLADTESDEDGLAEISVPDTPGCYQYKATKANNVRSNTLYLTVIS